MTTFIQLIVDGLARVAPGASANEVRAGLARLLFRGDRADQLVGTLSGGERLRATLAALLLAEPTPQLLLLDEPTTTSTCRACATSPRPSPATRGQ